MSKSENRTRAARIIDKEGDEWILHSHGLYRTRNLGECLGEDCELHHYGFTFEELEGEWGPLSFPDQFMASSFWEAAKRAVRQRNESRAMNGIHARRIDNLTADLESWRSQCGINGSAASSAEYKVADAEDQATAHRLRADSLARNLDVAQDECNRRGERIAELESLLVKSQKECAELQAQIDAFPYETGAPVGDRVAARLAEYRERTHAAEARAEKAERERTPEPVADETPRSSVLNEANQLIHSDRNAAYGPPMVNFQRTATIWSVILEQDVTPRQVADCMIALKLARNVEAVKRDNYVDMAGYAACGFESSESAE